MLVLQVAAGEKGVSGVEDVVRGSEQLVLTTTTHQQRADVVGLAHVDVARYVVIIAFVYCRI